MVATGPDTFYATNQFGITTNEVLKYLQLLLLLNTGNVVYYNSVRAHKIADGFGFSNGINMSPDGK